MARQAWPELTVAPTKSFGATSFSSTSSSTSAASLPPSSSVRRFNVPDAFAITLLPVAVDLVRVTFATTVWLCQHRIPGIKSIK